MKFNMNYATVKFILSTLLRDEATSQLVASHCQFVNDVMYESLVDFPIKNLSDDFIKNRKNLYEKGKSTDKVKIKLSRTAVKQEALVKKKRNKDELTALEQLQKDILVPLYYFPGIKLIAPDYEIIPIKFPSTNKAIATLYEKIKEEYDSAQNKPSKISNTIRKNAIRKFGVLLHIIINSISYERFTGFESESNNYIIASAKDSVTKESMVQTYEKQGENMLNIGKYRVGTLTEDYNRRFQLLNNEYIYNRSTNYQFPIIAQTIYDYAYHFFNSTKPKDKWSTDYLPLLEECWKYDNEDQGLLCEKWAELTDVTYDYSFDDTIHGITEYISEIKKGDNQPLIDYVVFIDDIRLASQSVLRNEENKPEIVSEYEGDYAKVSSPCYQGNKVEFVITPAYKKVKAILGDSYTMQIRVSEKNQYIFSDAYDITNMKNVNQSIYLDIFENDTTLDFYVTFSNETTKNLEFRAKVAIKGNQSLIKSTQLLAPSSEKQVVTIMNGSEKPRMDYNYPNNLVYTSQSNNRLLDILTPFDIEITLSDKTKLMNTNELKLSLSTKKHPEPFIYCNNNKFISFIQDEVTGNVRVKADPSWKNQLPYDLLNDFDSVNFLLTYDIDLTVYNTDEEGYRNIKIKGPATPIILEYNIS